MPLAIKPFPTPRAPWEDKESATHLIREMGIELKSVELSMVTQSSDQVLRALRTARLEKRCQSTDAPKLCWCWKTPDEVFLTQECSTFTTEIPCICWLTAVQLPDTSNPNLKLSDTSNPELWVGSTHPPGFGEISPQLKELKNASDLMSSTQLQSSNFVCVGEDTRCRNFRMLFGYSAEHAQVWNQFWDVKWNS